MPHLFVETQFEGGAQNQSGVREAAALVIPYC
jgi:hypothetical protein